MVNIRYENLVLMGLSVLVGLILCELTLRMFVSIRNVGPAFSIYDPVYGQRLKTRFYTQRTSPEFTMRFSTNSLGFRGPEPKSFPYQPILFLGDSFTEGYGVNDGEEYPALIREFVGECYGENAVPVVNAGIGRNGTGRWLKFLKAEGPQFAPRLVVFQLFANDFEDNVRERLFDVTPDGELVELPVSPGGTVRVVQTLIEAIPGLAYSHLVGFARQVYWHFTRKQVELDSSEANKDKGRRYDRLTFRLVEEVLALAESQGWPVLGLLVGVDGERLEQLQQIFRRRNIPFVEIAGNHNRVDLYYQVDQHWSAFGHRHAAKLVAGWLSYNESVWQPKLSTEEGELVHRARKCHPQNYNWDVFSH